MPSNEASSASESAATAQSTRTREVEWKLVSDEDMDFEGIRALLTDTDLGEGSTIRLTATYYDTADLRLARRGITLRRRTGGHDDGWHLKLPNRPAHGEVLDRDEIALPLEHSDDPPAELRSLVAAYARSGEIHVIGVLRTHRAVHPLVVDGVIIGELCRDEVRADIARPDQLATPTVVFHEWEVEARAGAVAKVESIVNHLLAHGFTRSTSESKLRQALGDAALIPDALTHDESPTRRRSAREDITYYLKDQVEALLVQDHRVRLELPDAVHRSRVAARRLRSALRTFAPVLDSEALAPLRADIVWAADIFGRERDLEVIENRLVETLDSMTNGDDPAAAHERHGVQVARTIVVEDLRERRAEAHRSIIEAFDSPRWINMLDQLVDLAHDPPTTGRAGKAASRVLPPLALKQWKALSDRAKHLTNDDPAESWHHARISAKRARYAAEACAPAMGHEPARFAEALAEVTELLGDLQDTQVSRDYLNELVNAGIQDADAMFALGRLYSSEERAAERMRASFPSVWARAARPRLRRWLRG